MKSKRIREAVFWVHRYIGLAVGILAAIIGLTASLIILDDLWKNYFFAARVTPVGERLSITALIARAREILPDLTLEIIAVPRSLTESVTVRWLTEDENLMTASLNPYTGNLIGQPHDRHYLDFLLDLHINLLSGTGGHYVAGIVGLLATTLCVTGVILWPGWRKLEAGVKIKWNANIKRLNFDLHKVIGVIVAAFLSMAMLTGFIWNFGEWTDPIIYAVTLSPVPPDQPQPVSQSIAGQAPLAVTDSLVQKATATFPESEIVHIELPRAPEGTIAVWNSDGSTFVYLDQYNGKILRVDGAPTDKSVADRLFDWFGIVHFGTFAGIYSQFFYVFVGLSPTILLVTGFIMWRHRKKPRQPAVE
jgi:uncharacterized iron-regulated membrane protein